MPSGDTYGPVAYEAYLPALLLLRLERKMGQAPDRPRDLDPVGHPGHDRAPARRPALRRASTRGHARVRVGRLAARRVLDEQQHERPDRAGAAHLGLLLRHGPVQARALRRALRLDEVRDAARRAALVRLPGRRARPPAPAVPRRVRGGNGARVLRRALRAARRRTTWSSSSTTRSATSTAARRRSRSGTGGSTTPRGLPDLRWVQRVLQVVLVAGALVLARWPRHRTPLRLAAYTGALLVGFEAILTYWSFSYLIWFFPFVVYAVVAPRTESADREDEQGPGRGRGSGLRRSPTRASAGRPGSASVGGAVLVAVAFIGSWALLTHGPYANPRIIDTADLPALRRRDPHWSRPVPRLRGRVSARARSSRSSLATFGGDYRSTFGWLMAGCGLLLPLVRGAGAGRRAAHGCSWRSSRCSSARSRSTRFDFWPAALAIGALAAFLRDRHRLGWAALGAAFAAKLFPAVLVPLAVVWTLRRRGRTELVRGLGCFGAVVLAIFVPFFSSRRAGCGTA